MPTRAVGKAEKQLSALHHPEIFQGLRNWHIWCIYYIFMEGECGAG